MARREFSVAGAHRYDRSGAVRWIASHLARYRPQLVGVLALTVVANGLGATMPVLTGRAFDAVLRGADPGRLAAIALTMLGVVLAAGAADMSARFSAEFLAKRLERDARDELYLSLLGKSQTFHNRQRVGDIMARAANDVRQINSMVVPGLDIIYDSTVSLALSLTFIGLLDPRLLAAPLLFTAVHLVALRDYSRRLNPVAGAMRERFGALNAGLAETVAGIEVVKSTAQEGRERHRFEEQARRYRDAFVANGRVQARYLPTLLLAVAMAGAFLHGVWLVSRGELALGTLVAYLGLMALLRYPVQMGIWTFNLAQLGLAAAERILALLREETELDENAAGHRATIRGEIVFERVTFRYAPGGEPVLRDVSFRAAPGETVAIVGQTGAGKSTLTRLVNRIYDPDEGRVLVDGVDTRDWNLEALRSQVASIEQDVFLFSRTIAENIAFGAGPGADRAAVERAAHDAQAHDFVASFRDGYETVIGERGVTLSGGQRQRLAIARALLTDPRILILDDSTSAIDSATEDEIQRAIRRVLAGRTTLLITHRLSQIRRADRILVLRRGALVDQGTHEELLGRCELYRRIFGVAGQQVAGRRSAGVGVAASEAPVDA